jgi:hypothetical protein
MLLDQVEFAMLEEIGWFCRVLRNLLVVKFLDNRLLQNPYVANLADIQEFAGYIHDKKEILISLNPLFM